MDSVAAFFKGLFDTDQWPARWHCGNWVGFLGWLYIISDLALLVNFILIPLFIVRYFTNRERRAGVNKVYILFASFLLLCGATYFFDVLVFWVPMNRLNTLLRMVTAILGLFTIYRLVKILPAAFLQKQHTALDAEIAHREEIEKQLREANTNLRAFTSVASHDLQEPLRKIRTYASLLSNVSEPPSEERKQELLEKIENSSVRMQTMIKDILTLSTIMASADFGRVNINDAIRMAMEELEIKITEKKAVIDVQLMPDVKGSKEYLSQVFTNLIGNAIKFSRTTPHISITCQTKESTVVISVQDNGIGIEAEYVDRIFLAFQRLNSRTAYDGSGLGLAICKRIVELHKGTIHVVTEPGVGATFIIEIPKA